MRLWGGGGGSGGGGDVAVGTLTIDDFCCLSTWAEEKATDESIAFWFRIADVDADGVISEHDARWLVDQIHSPDGGERASSVGSSSAKTKKSKLLFENVWRQVIDMANASDATKGISLSDVRRSKLGRGIFGVLFNHNDMLLRRSSAEFSNKDVPL